MQCTIKISNFIISNFKNKICPKIQNGTVAFLDSVDFGDSGRGVALLEEALRVHVAGLLPPGRSR